MNSSAIVSLALAFSLFLSVSGDESAEVEEYCSEPICFDEAHRLRQSMNENVDPCDDMYEFACGGFPRDHPLPASRASTSQLEMLQDRVQGMLVAGLSNLTAVRSKSDAILFVKKLFESCNHVDKCKDVVFLFVR